MTKGKMAMTNQRSCASQTKTRSAKIALGVSTIACRSALLMQSCTAFDTRMASGSAN